MKINQRGFWENMTARDVQKEHAFDKELSNALKQFFIEEKITTIADLGCGLGNYTKVLNNETTKCDGFDGNPNTKQLTNNLCNILDLSNRFSFDEPYDWVLSLEVGEHLPQQFEQTFIDNICSNNKYGIVLSWALKGQGGKGHFNEQNNDYVINKIEHEGFVYDEVVSSRLRQKSTLSWFKNTIMVFRRGCVLHNTCVDVPLTIQMCIYENTPHCSPVSISLISNEFKDISFSNLNEWPLFVSFYTINTGYESEVQHLLNSLKQFNLPYHIEGIPSTGDWVTNCAMKPSFILKMMNTYPSSPIVWVDADAVIESIPTLFKKNNIRNLNDIMCGFLNPELLSGTIYIKNNPNSKNIISKWKLEQENNVTVWDQKILQRIQQQHKRHFSYLPHSYIKIFDNPRMKLKHNEIPVIIHNQASRRFKLII